MDIRTCIQERKTIRGFLNSPVSRDLVQELLADAHRAPSASNQQPWIFHVAAGEPLKKLCARIQHARSRKSISYDPSRGKTIPREYVERTKQLFKGLRPFISRLGDENRTFIESGSYRFYDAPVVIFISMLRDLPESRLMDIGMAAQNLMLSAHGRGLGTCAIALTLLYADVIQAELGIPAGLDTVLSIALGYPDTACAVNEFRSSRDDLGGFVTWAGFGE